MQYAVAEQHIVLELSEYMNRILKSIMRIEFLKHFSEFIPLIAKWFYQEWGHYHPELSLQDIEERLYQRINTNKIPLALVAVENEEVVGTVSLKKYDMDTRKQYSPWLSSMYVREDKRKQGIGKQLVQALENKAKELGVKILYLYTPDAEDFYHKYGWQTFEHVKYRSAQVSVMKKKLISEVIRD